MRPINLKVQGINSYVTEQEIKFDKLAESKLFGIFGETGSGKTTILDSIVLALYGSSERETISNMINVNVRNAHIYFVFEVEQEDKVTRYEVKREYKLRDSGVKQDAILTEVKTQKVLADMTESVNEKIFDIIGVGKKEFLKCIALPQGEFDRFLTDTPAVRKKTIAKLFNLEHFGAVLQEKIKMRKEISNLKLLNVQDKINMYDGVSQEALFTAHVTLTNKNKRLKELRKELKQADKRHQQLVQDFDVMTKLIDNMAQLDIKNNEVSDINYLKQQIEFTEKYGNFILFFNKQQTFETELEKIKFVLENDKKELKQVSNEILTRVDKLSELQSQQKDLNHKLKLSQEMLDKYNKEKMMLNELELEHSKVTAEVNELFTQVAELSSQVKNLEMTLGDQQQSKDRLQALVNDNNSVLDKIRDTKMVKTVDDFIDYLNYLKNIIHPDSLQEVYQYEIFGQINELVTSIQNYELNRRHDVADLKNEYEKLLRYNKDLLKLQSDLEVKNKELNTAIAKIDATIEKSKNLVVVTQTQITERKNVCQTKIALSKNLDVKILASKVALKQFKDIDENVRLQNLLQDNEVQLANLTQEIHELTDKKNSLVISVEVNSANIENINRELRDVVTTLRTLKIKCEDKNVTDNFYLDSEALQEAKERVQDYERTIAMLKASVNELKTKLVHKDVTKEDVESAQKLVHDLREEENRINVDIGILTQQLDTLKDSIKVLKQLNKEKQEIEKDLEVVVKLQNLIAGGGLLEYVSEEYMSLITDFANKFVYKISKGKYMLKYRGEFYVLDNFNGGVARGVKTLSGGERFIISLSLALGISQSISVNNNHAFNFFFIDEGFGSLSEDYIENVLNSFNELIKLDFTVGFISHVEKMQNFINNRIIVTKPSNEEGTLVKQYF